MLKVFFTHADAKGNVDGTLTGMMRRWDEIGLIESTELDQADVIFLGITHLHNFLLDKELADRCAKKPVIALDYIEYGWQSPPNTFCFGSDQNIPNGFEPAWLEMHAWLKSLNRVVYFKRDLPLEHASTVHPIDYIGYFDLNVPVATLDQFKDRMVDLNFIFGPSNPNRTLLYGEMHVRRARTLMKKATLHRDVCSLSFPEHPCSPRSFVTDMVYAERRHSHEDMQKLYSMSCLSASLNGCGIKCFRDAELWDTVVARQSNTVDWAYPWIDGENCIILPEEKPMHLDVEGTFDKVESALRDKDRLYDLYLRSRENMINYHYTNYGKSLLHRITALLG